MANFRFRMAKKNFLVDFSVKGQRNETIVAEHVAVENSKIGIAIWFYFLLSLRAVAVRQWFSLLKISPKSFYQFFGALPAVRTKCVNLMARAFLSDEGKLENKNNQLFSLSNGTTCVQVNKKWNCTTVGEESLRAIDRGRKFGKATVISLSTTSSIQKKRDPSV